MVQVPFFWNLLGDWYHLSIHWMTYILFTGKTLRALRLKSSSKLIFKCPLGQCYIMVCVLLYSTLCYIRLEHNRVLLYVSSIHALSKQCSPGKISQNALCFLQFVCGITEFCFEEQCIDMLESEQNGQYFTKIQIYFLENSTENVCHL